MVGSRSPLNIPYRRPFYARTRFLFIGFLTIIIYSYGWRVTEIELGSLVRDAHLVKPLLRDFLKPDVLTFEKKRESASIFFILSDRKFPSRIAEKNISVPSLFLSKTTGHIGQSIDVFGKGFRPSEKGVITWINSIEQEYPLGLFDTDEKGNFNHNIVIPPIAQGDTQEIRAILEWGTGDWRFSDTLKLTLDKLVETVFLALMATTFSIMVAAPMSFFGARNLMMANPASTALYYTIRMIFNVLRSIEPLIMAILFAVWVGIGPFAGVLASGGPLYCRIGKTIFRTDRKY